MPSDQSTWLVSIPNDGDAEGIVPELANKLAQASRSFPRGNVAQLSIPSFKVSIPPSFRHALGFSYPLLPKAGTLDGLISLSEDLPKQESLFTQNVAKIVDTLRNLLNGDPEKLAQHTLVNEKSVDEYLLNGWRWNEGRYGVQRGLREMVDVLSKVRADLPLPAA